MQQRLSSLMARKPLFPVVATSFVLFAMIISTCRQKGAKSCPKDACALEEPICRNDDYPHSLLDEKTQLHQALLRNTSQSIRLNQIKTKARRYDPKLIPSSCPNSWINNNPLSPHIKSKYHHGLPDEKSQLSWAFDASTSVSSLYRIEPGNAMVEDQNKPRKCEGDESDYL